MTPGSIRFRLTAWYTAILAATLALVGAGVWLGMRQSIHETVDKDLRARMNAVRTRIEKELAAAEPGAFREELAELGEAAGGARLRVTDRRGASVFDSTEGRGWPAPPADPSRLSAKGHAATIWVRDLPLRSLRAPVRVRGDSWTVEVAAPIDEYYEMLDAFGWTACLAAPLLLLLATAGGYWMSGRALAPVDRITRTAQSIGARNLSARLPLGGSGDELDRLSATLNAMFERLEAAFQRITRFTADASHELRTPVAIVRTTAELALSKPRQSAEYVKALEGVLKESERASSLIEGLMELVRADAGAEGVASVALDLSDALREACAEIQVLADAAQLRLATDIPPEFPAHGDAAALRRLFLILLDNAVKYTPPGGEIHVSLSRSEGAAAVEVRDTGVGIAAEDLPHIFERFYRAAQDRSRSTGGAGLGLSIAKWIAARHGGQIAVESEPGRGAAFRVLLPLGSSSANLQDSSAY